MSKYASLGTHLRSQPYSEVPMSFADVENVIGTSLPASAKYPAWWSNNPSNNVMTKIWLDAGFQTERVDVSGRKLVFRRVNGQPLDNYHPGGSSAPTAAAMGARRHPIFGAMKDITHLVPGVDLTEPADPDWADIAEGKILS